MTLDAIKTALAGTNIPVALYGWSSRPSGDFLVCGLDGQGQKLDADDGTLQKAVEGSVDLFTKDTTKAKKTAVEAVLESLFGSAWMLNSIQYESDTRLIHYEYVFQYEE